MWAYMPSQCLQESQDSTSALSEHSSDLASMLEQHVMWRGKHTASRTWSRRLKRESWLTLLSGLTLDPSMLEHGAQKWISSLPEFPCQDISDAGKRAGIRDGEKSSLWKQVIRVACESRARFICLENVAAITFRGLDDVLGDIAKAGYDAIWACVSVDEVGGTQKRDRWFCLAYANDCGLPWVGLQQRGEAVYAASPVAEVVAGRGAEFMGDTMRPRRGR